MEKITIRYNSDTLAAMPGTAYAVLMWLIAIVGTAFYFQSDDSSDIMLVLVILLWICAGISAVLVLCLFDLMPFSFKDVTKSGK